MSNITELIKSYFPRLKEDTILFINSKLAHVSLNIQKLLLSYGKMLSQKDDKVINAFFNVAADLYQTLDQVQFKQWIDLINQLMKMHNNTLIAFFDATPILIQNNSLKNLIQWTELGLSSLKENKTLINFYFLYTANLFINSSYVDFKSFIDIGKNLSYYNIRLNEAYFRNLSIIYSLLSINEFYIFIDLIYEIVKIDWRKGVELFINFNERFSSIIPGKRFLLIHSMHQLLKYDLKLAIALFNKGSSTITYLYDDEFKIWLSLIEKLAVLNLDISISFVNKSVRLFDQIKMNELESWVSLGINLLYKDKNAAKNFFDYSFAGLDKQLEHINLQEQSFLLEIGAELAILNPECVENYFKYAPQILQLVTHKNFKEWLKIGKTIAHMSTTLGSGYCKYSALALKQIPTAYHGDVLSTAHLLLSTDWMLAGIFFQSLPDVVKYIDANDIKKWAGIGLKVYNRNKKMAVDYFAFSPSLLHDLDVKELEVWAFRGIHIFEQNNLSGRPFFSLKSKNSTDFIEELKGGVNLKKVSNILKYYALGLSGIEFSIRSKNLLPITSDIDFPNPIIANNIIYLEPQISKYGGSENNFNIYKASVLHEIGHVQFSTSFISVTQANELFSSSGFKFNIINEYVNTISLFNLFSNPIIAKDIFGIIEDARIEYMLLKSYKGIHDYFKNVRSILLSQRIIPTTDLEQFIEYLLWLSTENKPSFIPKRDIKINKLFFSLSSQIFNLSSSVFDSLKITIELYNYIENIYGSLKSISYTPIKNISYRGVEFSSLTSDVSNSSNSDENMLAKFVPQSEVSIDESISSKKFDIMSEGFEAIQSNGWTVNGTYNYDEWDATINDYKSLWCTLKEIEPKGDYNSYFDETINKYHNEINMLKRVFSGIRPESFEKLKNQTDGIEIDFDVYIDNLIQQYCGAYFDDRFYIKWNKKERDIASLLLVDVSASTSKKVRGQIQSIIDVEKDALIVMSQALESIHDKYAIYAFSGHTRHEIEYYLIKDFNEKFSENVAQRISLLVPVSNTRLGCAIRHSISKLQSIKSKTKIIILLSDGEPYDTVHGEGAYEGYIAEEDTRIAIEEAERNNIHFFCITVDSKSEKYLDRIFSKSSYTIIDDVQKLPILLPALYKRLTT